MGELAAEGTVGASTQLVLVFAFLSINTAFNLYNKWMFTPADKDGAGLSIPLMATAFHSLTCFLTAFVLQFIPSIFVPAEVRGTKRWMQVLCISVLFATTIGLNNTSLMHLPVSVQQTIRACSPVAIAIASYFIEDKTYTFAQIAMLVTLVGGIVCTVISNDSAGLVGVMLAVGSVISGSLYYSFISLHVGPSGKLGVLDIMLYTSIPVVIALTPIVFAVGEHNALADFVSQNSAGEAIVLILIGCVFAVTYNMLTFTFIAMLSAVYLSVVANFKLVLLIVFGIVMFDDKVTVGSGIGLLIATAGFCGYSYLEYKIREEKANAPKSPSSQPEAQSLLGGNKTT